MRKLVILLFISYMLVACQTMDIPVKVAEKWMFKMNANDMQGVKKLTTSSTQAGLVTVADIMTNLTE
ncbi:MAG: hypothetical protein GY816_08080 [Cytophagales bacterium]|nr:hypothetical protein [Cytophagales bacterium]